MKDTWTFQANLMRRLRTWALANLFGGGVLLLLRGQPFWQGFGSQAIGWGFVNALLAVFGGRAAESRRTALPNPHDPQIHARENQNLRRILWINAVLDVFYVLGGLTLAQREWNHPQRRGMGWGIVFQGAFLFGFDVLNAFACPHPDPLSKGEGIEGMEGKVSSQRGRAG